MTMELYVMTHKKYREIDDPMYKTLHVGRKLAGDLGYEGDDTGDSISEKNKTYCELTGLYWLWKNKSSDVIGICHYRRFFLKNERFLTQEYIADVLTQYDIIMPFSEATRYGSVWEDYGHKHRIADLVIVRNVIERRHGDYLPAFDFVMEHNLLNIGNMFIAPKPIYDAYCEWLFDILFEAEKEIDLSNRDGYQMRVMGFLSERLLRVWVIHNGLRVKEEKVMLMDSDEISKHLQRRDLVYRFLSLVSQDVLKEYIEGTYRRLPPLAEDVGADGRIPLWICWWQGLEQAPELVKRCVASVRRNISKDRVDVRIITLENYSEYVEFSPEVHQYFGQGKISMATLSDMLRSQLLFRYGGIWMDATYYVTDNRINEILERDFFTIKIGKKLWDDDVVEGRWSGNFMKAEAGNPLSGFVMDAFHQYYRMRESLIEYFAVDYFIAIAYDNIAWVKETIDSCPISNPSVMKLSEIANHLYREETAESLLRNTYAYKMNYRMMYREQNLVGESTFYGKIVVTQIVNNSELRSSYANVGEGF